MSEHSDMKHARPIAFGLGREESLDTASFPVGKLPELLDPQHPAFDPDVLKLWQVWLLTTQALLIGNSCALKTFNDPVYNLKTCATGIYNRQVVARK